MYVIVLYLTSDSIVSGNAGRNDESHFPSQLVIQVIDIQHQAQAENIIFCEILHHTPHLHIFAANLLLLFQDFTKCR